MAIPDDQDRAIHFRPRTMIAGIAAHQTRSWTPLKVSQWPSGPVIRFTSVGSSQATPVLRNVASRDAELDDGHDRRHHRRPPAATCRLFCPRLRCHKCRRQQSHRKQARLFVRVPPGCGIGETSRATATLLPEKHQGAEGNRKAKRRAPVAKGAKEQSLRPAESPSPRSKPGSLPRWLP